MLTKTHWLVNYLHLPLISLIIYNSNFTLEVCLLSSFLSLSPSIKDYPFWVSILLEEIVLEALQSLFRFLTFQIHPLWPVLWHVDSVLMLWSTVLQWFSIKQLLYSMRHMFNVWVLMCPATSMILWTTTKTYMWLWITWTMLTVTTNLIVLLISDTTHWLLSLQLVCIWLSNRQWHYQVQISTTCTLSSSRWSFRQQVKPIISSSTFFT